LIGDWSRDNSRSRHVLPDEFAGDPHDAGVGSRRAALPDHADPREEPSGKPKDDICKVVVRRVRHHMHFGTLAFALQPGRCVGQVRVRLELARAQEQGWDLEASFVSSCGHVHPARGGVAKDWCHHEEMEGDCDDPATSE